ncbi:hypothetical protein OIE67_17825 [Nonomuraea fuscirosea]|nr:hypothetical protein [Nonomuraea fuscirosea]WSA56395.1 hypothetical protein OIE67_17825 [Nonomuraea fuscirosea]
MLNVLRVQDGKIAEITAFEPRVLPRSDLPLTLSWLSDTPVLDRRPGR